MVVTRFAPSPTGYLHIGSARTALFNYLFAKHHGGKYLLRVEDTDRARSTGAAVDALINGLAWLGIEHDGEIVYQFSRKARHAEIATKLVQEGSAYYCYASQTEIMESRDKALSEKKPLRFISPWRDFAGKPPLNAQPVVRLKAPSFGTTIINDLVQGKVEFQNTELDDMVLLRSDGTPTYMLAVVVDDIDMNITHIIRGDDHLNNAARQQILYDAINVPAPLFAHIPLIHGPDGAKLSKRHGALGVEAYRDMGYLPETMCNYLLRLGWSHNDDEIISMEQAISLFNLEAIGRSPSRLDFKKLDNLNAHYIKAKPNSELLTLIKPLFIEYFNIKLTERAEKKLIKAMDGLKLRAKTLKELVHNALFYIVAIPAISAPAKEILVDPNNIVLLKEVIEILNQHKKWVDVDLQILIKQFAEQKTLKLGEVAQVIRAALTGSTNSPSIFEIMEVLEKDETLSRLNHIIG